MENGRQLVTLRAEIQWNGSTRK